MDFSKLIRDSSKIQNILTEIPDGRLVTKREVKMYIPARFEECGLAFIGAETNIVGIYAIVLDDTYYAISLVNAMMRIEPTSILKVEINDIWYYEFTFEAGSTVISDVKLVKTDTLVYQIYNEIISKGHVPAYINYMDLGKLFDTAKYHAGANIGGNREVSELLISLISRDTKDKHKYYRHVIKSKEDMIKKPPAYISIKSIIYAATNTTNKLAGSYFSEAVVSSLVSPSTRNERIEDLLMR